MPDRPTRLVVLERLSALLEGTDGPQSDGTPYNLVGRVHRGRIEFGTETQLPALSVLEAPTPDIGIFAGGGEAKASQWVLLIQGWDVEDSENPTDNAHWLAAATIERLSRTVAKDPDGRPRPAYPDDYFLGLGDRVISSLEFGPPVVRPADGKTSSKAFFYLPIRVGLAQYVSRPYLSV